MTINKIVSRIARISGVGRRPRQRRRVGAPLALAVVAGLKLLVALPAGAADLTPHGYRLQHALDKFEDTSEFALEYRYRAPQLLRADRLELAVGTLSDGSVSRPFVSLGPVWRRNIGYRGFVDFGFSPTVFSGSRIGGDDLGGNFHFTSSLSAGWRFGEFGRYSISFRAQHTSNGGISSTNPGLDVVGLRFAVEFAQ